MKVDLPYGEGEANRFDLYLPKDNTRETYGLAVYLHAGGFTIHAETVAALRPGMDHGKMLYSADGYVTDWFMWQLQGDETAAQSFNECQRTGSATHRAAASLFRGFRF